MKIYEEYKKLDKDERQVIFAGVWMFATMFVLFASYYNIYLVPVVFIMLFYMLYFIHNWGNEEEEEKKK